MTGWLWPVADRDHLALTDRCDLEPAAHAPKDASRYRTTASVASIAGANGPENLDWRVRVGRLNSGGRELSLARFPNWAAAVLITAAVQERLPGRQQWPSCVNCTSGSFRSRAAPVGRYNPSDFAPVSGRSSHQRLAASGFSIVRSRSARRSPRHHRPRCRGSGLSTQAWHGPVGVERPARRFFVRW